MTTSIGQGRDELIARLQALSPEARATVAARWPDGVPTFKQTTEHDGDQLATIQETLDGVEFDLNEAPATAAEGDKAELSRADGLRGRYDALAPDLRDRTDVAAGDHGIPQNFAWPNNYIGEDLDVADTLLTEAEADRDLRRRTVHAAFGDAGIDDDQRHGILHYLSAGRTTSSTDLTEAETTRAVEIAKSIELDRYAITFGEGDNGALIVVDTDGMPAPPAPPYGHDWKQWARTNGLKIGDIIRAAKQVAADHGHAAPRKVDEIIGARYIAATLRLLDTAATCGATASTGDEKATPAPATPLVADDGGALPPTTGLLVLHQPDGRIRLWPVTDEIAARFAELLDA